MVAIQQRNNPVRLFGRRVRLFFLVVLVMAGISGVWDVYHKDFESQELKQEALVQLADLQLREAQLNTDIGNLETDRGKEAALRQQYEMARPGEGEIVIVDQPEATSAATSTPQEGWFARIFHWW